MSFGEALEALKQGKKVSRNGWNGKKQYIRIPSIPQRLPKRIQK